jgi:ribosome-associated toxin RatA of RatAB toxin-antitoxin module
MPPYQPRRSGLSLVGIAGRCGVLLIVSLIWSIPSVTAFNAASHVSDKIEVRTDPGGGFQAEATLHLNVAPSVVLQVLTDYENWPHLFGTPTRLTLVLRRPDRVVTDVYIRHPILPGESRLLCETRLLPEGGLVTSLIEGDFTRYRRTWRLTGEEEGRATMARFELLVDVKTWAPDWLVAIELRRQLEKHFRILRETASARAGAH